MIARLRSRLGLDKPERRFRDAFGSLRPGVAAIDCGANVGRFTELMAASGATVYAIEPHPGAAEALRKRFVDTKNVAILEAAIGTEDGQARLHLHVDHAENELKWSVGSSVYAAKGNVLDEDYVAVEVIDFAAFIHRIPEPVALVKMDVEGAEVPVLLRLIETGTLATIPHVLVELHEISGLEEGRARLDASLPGFPNVRTNWD